jgi:hypothetical protein
MSDETGKSNFREFEHLKLALNFFDVSLLIVWFSYNLNKI